jgi:hypothetical protein
VSAGTVLVGGKGVQREVGVVLFWIVGVRTSCPIDPGLDEASACRVIVDCNVLALAGEQAANIPNTTIKVSLPTATSNGRIFVSMAEIGRIITEKPQGIDSLECANR